MNTKWLEDLVALSKSPNLYKAAELRNVTHPAFGRRIRALEDWAGVPLVERGRHAATLTPAGRTLLASAAEVLEILRETHSALQKPDHERARKLSIASGRTLSHSVLPRIVESLQRALPPFQLKVVTTSLNYGVDMLAGGEVDLLLCHAHDPLYEKIDNPGYRQRRVGTDKLVAVSAPLPGGHPRHRVPRLRTDAPVPFLDYADSMSLGKILRSRLRGICHPPLLRTVYESDLADAIHAMVRQGFGLAWLPHTLVERDLRSGELVRADVARNDIAMEIRLYRAVDNPKPLVRRAWEEIERRAG